MAQHNGQQGGTPAGAAASPSPSDLLRAALEKIVFFEWRVGELAAELAAAQTRAASADAERLRAEEQARLAQVQAQAARLSLAELEADRARLAALLARPAHAAHADVSPAALEAERMRAAQLQAELGDARREIDRQRAERDRWLLEMIEQARSGGEAPAALAEFISELRGEVIALRERARLTDAALQHAGLPLPPPSQPPPPASEAVRDESPVEEARVLWAQGRLGGARAEQELARAAQAAGQGMAEIAAPAPVIVAHPLAVKPRPAESIAARALADQCLRGLQSSEPARRAQAALHLAAVPSSAAGPLVAHALGVETDAKAKAALVHALVACGGHGAADLVHGLLAGSEPPLVRLAVVDALAAAGGERAVAALEAGARDPSPAIRRRTASLLLASGERSDLLALLRSDADASVRSACAESTETGFAGAAAAPRRDERALPAIPATRIDPPRPAERDLATEAQHACRAAIFGLTEDELAGALGIGATNAAELAAGLIASGSIGRRGKRLVWRGESQARAEESR